MNAKSLERIKDMMCDELEDMVNSGKMDLTKIHMLTDTIKNIDKIEAMDEGYSEGMWNARGSYNDGDSYGRHWVRGHYSNRNRYSSAKDEIEDHIRERLNDNSLSPGERESLRRAMDSMR